MGSSPPQQQNPSLTASVQQQLNQQSGIQSQAGSLIPQSNVLGSTNYQQIGTGPGGIPLYGETTSLSPTQQGLYNTQVGTQQLAGQQGQNLIGGANYGSTSPTTAIGTESTGIEGGLMNQWLSSQAPWLTLQTQQLDTQLKNQGLAPGNPAYDNAMTNLIQGQTQGVAGAASQFQPQAFSEASSLYQMPAQLGESLASFGQYTSPTSQLIQTPGLNVSPANYESDVNAYNQQQLQEWAAQQQMMGSIFGGLAGLGGTLGGASILAGGLGGLGAGAGTGALTGGTAGDIGAGAASILA